MIPFSFSESICIFFSLVSGIIVPFHHHWNWIYCHFCYQNYCLIISFINIRLWMSLIIIRSSSSFIISIIVLRPVSLYFRFIKKIIKTSKTSTFFPPSSSHFHRQRKVCMVIYHPFMHSPRPHQRKAITYPFFPPAFICYFWDTFFFLIYRDFPWDESSLLGSLNFP